MHSVGKLVLKAQRAFDCNAGCLASSSRSISYSNSPCAQRDYSSVALQGSYADYKPFGLVAALLQQVAVPLSFAYFILRSIARNGRRLVNRPQLCPGLAHPWLQDAAVHPGGAQKH